MSVIKEKVESKITASAHGNGLPVAKRRDLFVLRFISEQYAVRLDQLAALLGRTTRTAQNWRATFEEAGWIHAKRLFVEEPAFVWLTRKGQHHAGTGFKAWQMRLSQLPHIVAVNNVRMHITQRAPESRWICERELARELDRKSHLPDAVIQLNNERHAVEVELTPKAKPRVVQIVSELHSNYDAVVYFCTPETKRQITKISRSQSWNRLVIRDLKEVGQ